MVTIPVFVVVWVFQENVRPMESEHFYEYSDAERYAETLLEDGEMENVRFYRIEKRHIVR